MPMIGRTLSHYRILEKIGAGGMGEVYRAHDESLDRDVALKVLPEAFAQDASRLARFKREAHLLASLNHPHIAAIYGLEEEDGRHCLVLELVEGETLASAMRLLIAICHLSSAANTVRPHQALGYLTPHQFLVPWQSQPKEAMCH